MREGCLNFDTCSAPLCPLDKDSLENGIWYPDEEICRKRNAPAWVKAQRKIVKKTKDNDKYFTYEMLNRNCKIVSGIVGLDPDKSEEPQLRNWLAHHKPKRQFSEEEKQEIRERLKQGRAKK